MKEDAWAPYFYDEVSSSVRQVLDTHEPECEWMCLDEKGDIRPVVSGPEVVWTKPTRWLVTIADTGILTAAGERSELNPGDIRVPFRRLRGTAGNSDSIGALVADAPSADFYQEPAFDVKLVVISGAKGKLLAGLVWDESELHVCDYFNALWVSQNDGDTCSRKGLARIEKTAWQACPNKSFETVKLG